MTLGESVMRKLFVGAAVVLAFAAPAAADTLQEVVKHGIVMTMEGMEFEVLFTPDGKFSAADGAVTGTWRIDGKKFCTTTSEEPDESCTVYPDDKKSGDTFEVSNSEGAATIRIK
jgi:hypothetical protein